MAQFENVSSRYGAPMGRRADGYLETRIKRYVRLFRVRINQQGYDDGGAYWGIGEPLFCAIDDDGNRQFVRAASRFIAAVKLDIPASALKSGIPGWTNTYCRYADNRPLLKLHGITEKDFFEWAKWSGVAMRKDSNDYQLGVKNER